MKNERIFLDEYPPLICDKGLSQFLVENVPGISESRRHIVRDSYLSLSCPEHHNHSLPGFHSGANDQESLVNKGLRPERSVREYYNCARLDTEKGLAQSEYKSIWNAFPEFAVSFVLDYVKLKAPNYR